MTIGPFSDSYSIALKANATTGAPELDGTPVKGYVDGVIAGATGWLNGGRTAAVGAAHTTVSLAGIALGAKFADTIRKTPLIGEFLS